MTWFGGLKRQKHLRGYGVHSPFAFNLIRKVFSCTAHYYAFDDINRYLTTHFPDEVTSNEFLHQLSFKLVNYFKVKEILEVHSGKGINTLYLLAPTSEIHCTCVEEREEQVIVARDLTSIKSDQCTLMNSLPTKRCYEAIFLYLDEENPPTLNSLFQLSGENCFWVIYPLNISQNKQLWSNIVNDKRFGITFTKQNIGVAFLRESYSKLHFDV